MAGASRAGSPDRHQRSRANSAAAAGLPSSSIDHHPHRPAGFEGGRSDDLAPRARLDQPDPELLGQLAPQAAEVVLAGLALAARQIEDVRRGVLAHEQQTALDDRRERDDIELVVIADRHAPASLWDRSATRFVPPPHRIGS
jgi:hypothetical protein